MTQNRGMGIVYPFGNSLHEEMFHPNKPLMDMDMESTECQCQRTCTVLLSDAFCTSLKSHNNHMVIPTGISFRIIDFCKLGKHRAAFEMVADKDNSIILPTSGDFFGV
jgi:hypothetical protein